MKICSLGRDLCYFSSTHCLMNIDDNPLMRNKHEAVSYSKVSLNTDWMPFLNPSVE